MEEVAGVMGALLFEAPVARKRRYDKRRRTKTFISVDLHGDELKLLNGNGRGWGHQPRTAQEFINLFILWIVC